MSLAEVNILSVSQITDEITINGNPVAVLIERSGYGVGGVYYTAYRDLSFFVAGYSYSWLGQEGYHELAMWGS